MLLEPVMLTEVTTPDEYTGEVIGDLSARRGNILGMDARGIARVVSAEVPLASMFGYATELRSRTKGRATFSMKFGFYSPMPPHVAEEVLSRSPGEALKGSKPGMGLVSRRLDASRWSVVTRRPPT